MAASIDLFQKHLGIEQELELAKRQKLTALSERLDMESKKLDEIYGILIMRHIIGARLV